MKSEKAKQHIIEHAEKNGDTCQYYIHESEVFKAVCIAEEEIKQRAVEAFSCFVKGYCNESGKKDIAKDSEHYIKVFEELINR